MLKRKYEADLLAQHSSQDFSSFSWSQKVAVSENVNINDSQ